MQHADIVADACHAIERNRPLTRHGQPVAGVCLHLMSERELCYYTALELVRKIEPHPGCDGSWRVGGEWYHSLGEVVAAILSEANQ